MNFGERLKGLRNGQKMMQKQFATRFGAAKALVSYYESGDRFPSYNVLIKIARTFHTTTDYLLGIELERTIDVSGLSEHEISAITNLWRLYRKNSGGLHGLRFAIYTVNVFLPEYQTHLLKYR